MSTHDAATVERLAQEADELWMTTLGNGRGDDWKAVVVKFLDREAPLLAALERVVVESERYQLSRIISRGAWDQAERALAAHRAATTPQEPSEREALRMAMATALHPAQASEVAAIVLAIEALVAVKVNAR